MGVDAKRLALRATMLLGITVLNPPHAGVVGISYTHTFLAFGGIPPYVWEMVSTLPSGWHFNAATATLYNTSPAGPTTFFITLFIHDIGWDHELPVTFPVTIVDTPSDLVGTFLATEGGEIFAYEDGVLQIPE